MVSLPMFLTTTILLTVIHVSSAAAPISGIYINPFDNHMAAQIWSPTNTSVTLANWANGDTTAGAKLDGKMYMFDPLQGGSSTVYEPAAGNSVEGPDLKQHFEAHGFLAVAAHFDESDVIVLCGSLADVREYSCERFLPNIWYGLDIDGMPYSIGTPDARDMTMVASFDGAKVFALTDRSSSAVYMNNAWTVIASVAPTTRYAALAIAKDVILTCGGVGAVRKCYTFGTADYRWTPLDESKGLNVGRLNFQMINYQGRIYALGGNDANGAPLSSVELYDQSTGTWQLMNNGLAMAVGSFSAVAF